MCPEISEVCLRYKKSLCERAVEKETETERERERERENILQITVDQPQGSML